MPAPQRHHYRFPQDRLDDQAVAVGWLGWAQEAELQAAVEDVHKTTAAVAGETDETLRRTRAILTDIEKTTAALPETTRSINRTAEALPGLVLQLQETLRQVQRTVEGLQRSFLVRGSVAPDETPGRIRPEDVGAGGR